MTMKKQSKRGIVRSPISISSNGDTITSANPNRNINFPPYFKILLRQYAHAKDSDITKILSISVPNVPQISTGTTPTKRASVVTPKANPGLFLITLSKAPKVIDIVAENRHTPTIEINIILFPIKRNGILSNVDHTAVFLAPILSEKYPPAAFPNPMIKNNSTVCQTSCFHSIGIAYPRKERTAVTPNAIVMTNHEEWFSLIRLNSGNGKASFQYLFDSRTKTSITSIKTRRIIRLIPMLPMICPSTRPKEPPATKSALGKSFPFETVTVAIAPASCSIQFPKAKIQIPAKAMVGFECAEIKIPMLINPTPIEPISSLRK